MSEEEKKAIVDFINAIEDCGLSDCAYNKELQCKELKNLIEKQQKEIEELKEDNEVYKNIIKIQNDREYRSKFLEEFQKEYGKNTFPDYDEIYKRYDNQKKEISELTISNKELDKECSRLERKEVEMQKEIEKLKYKIKRNYKHQEEMYISKQKIKDKIEEYLEYDKKYKTYLKDGRECFTIEYYKAKTLKELLEEE